MRKTDIACEKDSLSQSELSNVPVLEEVPDSIPIPVMNPEVPDMSCLLKTVAAAKPSPKSYVCRKKSNGHLYIFFLMLLVINLLADRWYPKSLPCDVNITSDGAFVKVNCIDRQLTSVPKGIPRNVTNLTLSINHIQDINMDSFAPLDNLIEIDFRCNCVPPIIGPKDHVCTKRPHIETGSFKSLNSLKALYLDGNQLLEIPQKLPPSLALLSLEVNSIISVNQYNLSGLSSIKMLYLGQNCYYRNPCNTTYFIDPLAFSNMSSLQILSLKSNNISRVPENLPRSLKELYLYNNMIQNITEIDFQNLSNLEILDLSGNCPRCYNSPFPCTPCPDNTPLQISPQAFDSLKKLKMLRLHSNSLKSIPYDWFKHIEHLKFLDLSRNYLIKEIGNAEFLTYLTSLEELDLSFNYELSVYATGLNLSSNFCKLNSLKILRIKGYVFNKLEEGQLTPLQSLKNLTFLDLGTNFIKSANLSIFQDFPSLKIINLSENKISPSSGIEESFSDSCVASSRTVGQYYSGTVQEAHYFMYDEYGRNCRSKEKEAGTFQPLHGKGCTRYGKTLDLSRNNIFFINPVDIRYLTIFSCLNLSGNALSQSFNGTEFKHLKTLKYLDFSDNRIDLLYSAAFRELKQLEVLDLSRNSHYFLAEGITHMLNFTNNLPKLRKLYMNFNGISTSTSTEMGSKSLRHLEFIGNRLDVIWRDGNRRYTLLFKNLTALKHLDISENRLSFLPSDVFENMPPHLEDLILKRNKLQSFNWGKLPYLTNLKTLDLSSNLLRTVPRELSNCTTSLNKFILRRNRIPQLTTHFLRNAFSLSYLDLSYNKLQFIQQSSFPEDVLNHLEVLLLMGNHFLCTCDAVWFVWWINQTAVNIPRLATDVTCSGPAAHQGKSVILLDLYSCELNSIPIILHSLSLSLILCLLLISITSHLFYWDVWYIYHFCSAKLKGYNSMVSQNACYDAYIAYDITDSDVSDWVLKELREKLEEQGDKNFNLCLEERDWVPGQPVMENLSQSIRLSKKTVFVLTNKYLNSGNFKTTFYMAHQLLLDEKKDVIILILLEKSLQNSKYLKLRKRLCRRSVLQWPTNPQAQNYFWQCLKTSLATDNHMQYSKKFQETV
ncbi:toll-like receptor 7 [Protopterus annectens]|uniref:toll-like receptor 7 n=1 Tax=Protopterus annectens TaxID=7888 RepID=UPI001CFBE440|nr:toll-like receptor 7 [Protopterus annectens]